MPLNQSTIDQITDWYRQDLGRDPRQEGLNFWASAASDPNANIDTLRTQFREAATRNGETVRTGGLINSTPSTSTTSFVPQTTTQAASTPSNAQTMTASTPTVTTTSATSAAAPSQPAQTPNVANWFRTALGRDPGASGLAFWEESARNQGAAKAYQDFLEAARRNNERVNAPTSWEDASNYTGPGSADATTVVDEWARNTLGRDLTQAERSRYDTAYNAAAARGDIRALDSLYAQFRADNAGEVQGDLDRVAASQIGQTRSATRPSENTTGTSATHLDPNALQRRIINPRNETVAGQLDSILAADSPYLQQARARGQRVAAGRGLINSSMAASAGEDAAISAALNVATPDAATYGRAADYNTALVNQASMFNAEADNQFSMQRLNIEADAATQQRQLQDAAAARAQQLSIANLQDATTRFQAELSSNTSRYNTDAGYRDTVERNRTTLVNNILMTTDLSPDRKAQLLESLGQGTSARRNADGTVTPGTGIAGAIYVIDSVAADLRPSTPTANNDVGGGGV